jgi:hypothetical protein
VTPPQDDGHRTHRSLGDLRLRFGSGSFNDLGVFGPSRLIDVAKAPSANALSDQHFAVIVGFQASSGKHSAVIGATGPWSVFINRAAIVDQHWAVSDLVEAHQHVPFGQIWCGEEQRCGYVRQRVGLIGTDMNEL